MHCVKCELTCCNCNHHRGILMPFTIWDPSDQVLCKNIRSYPITSLSSWLVLGTLGEESPMTNSRERKDETLVRTMPSRFKALSCLFYYTSTNDIQGQRAGPFRHFLFLINSSLIYNAACHPFLESQKRQTSLLRGATMTDMMGVNVSQRDTPLSISAYGSLVFSLFRF